MYSNDQIISIQFLFIQYLTFSAFVDQYIKENYFFRGMTQEEIDFYQEEKSKFDLLLKRFGWDEEHLFNEQKTLIQCPLDRNHRFPLGSKHLQDCQLVKEGFSKDYLREAAECKQEDRLLNQSAIVFPPSRLSQIVQRPIPITNNIPLNVEQMTVLFTPLERSLIARTVHDEASSLGLVPATLPSTTAVHPIQSQGVNLSDQSDKLAELRNRKRRRTKYVTPTARKSFYDTAREMINTEMELLEQQNTERTSTDQKRKKHKHRSSRSDSRKHHRHSKKRRKS